MAFKKRYIVLCALMALGVVVSQFPASWAAKITAPELPVKLGGTIWDGYVPSVNAVPPIAFKTSLAGLVTNAPVVKFSGSSNGLILNGAAETDRITELELKGNAIFLGQIDGRLANLMGRFDLTAANLNVSGDCADVSGQVSTDILARNTALWRWTGPSLSGPITCENGILTSTLSGNIPGQSVEAILKVIPDGRYQLRAVINTNTPEAGLVLPLYGFENQGERFTMNEAGRWM